MSVDPALHIAWIDVETTGLDPHHDLLLEIACIVTDADLTPVALGAGATGLSVVVDHDQATLDARLAGADHVRRDQSSGVGTACGAPADLVHDKVCQVVYDGPMATMNVSLPDGLKEFVEAQVDDGGYGTSSEFVRDLLRREQGRTQLRALLVDGMGSGPGSEMDEVYFERMRERIRNSGAA